uniref:Uncharacterized protein n=1 Tax=Vespula pensylvanica TaxID=30213 RepID=A0A834U522_VESPE|nr:hypothetical protein H0235_011610 [Vespula pensylvanica]
MTDRYFRASTKPYDFVVDGREEILIFRFFSTPYYRDTEKIQKSRRFVTVHKEIRTSESAPGKGNPLLWDYNPFSS